MICSTTVQRHTAGRPFYPSPNTDESPWFRTHLSEDALEQKKSQVQNRILFILQLFPVSKEDEEEKDLLLFHVSAHTAA